MVGSPGELDNNPLAQATAGESIANGLRPDDKFWHDLKLQPPVSPPPAGAPTTTSPLAPPSPARLCVRPPG